jgi:tungstate transport system substrate-binding protein
MLTRRHLIMIAASVVFGVSALAQEKSIVVASTTSTQDSGLFDRILPLFKAKTGIDVRVIAQGTGEALDTGRRGDADVVFVHDKPEEETFLAEGFGVKRYPVMYNDFILIWPNSDPAGIKGTKDIVAAFKSLKQKRVMFMSRGDRSGTHEAELKFWRAAGIGIFRDKELWYNQTGQGMGATLNMASATNAYVLSDRGTWLFFKNKGDLVIVVEGDTRLFNQYGVMLVSPQKHPNVKKELGQQFIDWLVSDEGQTSIADYKINGEQLFYPNANFTNPPTEPEEPVVARIKHDNSAERVKLMAMAKVFARICHMQLNQELRDSLLTDVLDVLGDPTVASIEDSARSATIDLLRQDEAQACVDGYNSMRLRIPHLLTFTFSR